MSKCFEKNNKVLKILFTLLAWASIFSFALTQEKPEEYEKVESSACVECHEKGKHDTVIKDDLSHSIHEGLECLDCHSDKNTVPHKEDSAFNVFCEGCGACHEDEKEQYKFHGRMSVEECIDIPTCADCHGDHDVLPSSVKHSKTHPSNVPETCAKCHEDINLTQKYQILIEHPIEIYKSSVHGLATESGVDVAATCNDCHSTGGTAHRILSPGDPDSTINHFNIPKTCGKCHEGIETEFWEGIHGQLVARGETDSPVCTNCHGEHGIISPNDPRSPVSKARLAEATCSPCHESITLTEKYGLPTGRLTSFIDSYHGLKTKAGDTHVANCASCHGVHTILPSSEPQSSIHPDNLQRTCGDCHPGISSALASMPIHGVGDGGLQTKAASTVKIVYIVAIVVIIGLMALHWLIDLIKQIVLVTRRPQVKRMRIGELWQHTLLTVSFIVLVITGFALRFDESWITKLFFGWEGGFKLRGTIHRVAAVILIFVTLWHLIYLITRRGRTFLRDMLPKFYDFKDFVQRVFFNLGLSKKTPSFKRFSYIEKAEYWALVWGTVVMIITGILLWFDNFFIHFLPKGVLDVALVIHYYEAILASLAVAIWHFYSTVFSPQVYPMNPSWLTGKMPADMFKHEHPEAKPEES
ncbi:MAG: cytochrome b/b6 domain-containing protein [Candidatus Aminicenantes bacterium]|nr:cytochrome b/b6 domain-containing protein [Candidatus Aminicenantes bacterium]